MIAQIAEVEILRLRPYLHMTAQQKRVNYKKSHFIAQEKLEEVECERKVKCDDRREICSLCAR